MHAMMHDRSNHLVEKKCYRVWGRYLFLLLLFTPLLGMKGEARNIYGRYERVIIPEVGEKIQLRAKLDSGAYTASLHATDIEYFKAEDGSNWVRFNTRGRTKKSVVSMELPLLRIAKIKQRIEEDELEIPSGNMALFAKLENGDLATYFKAEEVELFRRGGQQWIRFQTESKKGKERKIEIPLLASDEPDEAEEEPLVERPVVKVGLCLGDRIEEIEVNLTDRSNFTYPLLIGAKALRQFDAVIDAQERYEHPPICFEEPATKEKGENAPKRASVEE